MAVLAAKPVWPSSQSCVGSVLRPPRSTTVLTYLRGADKAAMPHAQQQSGRRLVDEGLPKSSRGLSEVMCEEPCEIGRVSKAEVLGNMRNGSRRIGQDAFGFEHEPIMNDRLSRQSELTTAGAAQVRCRDA